MNIKNAVRRARTAPEPSARPRVRGSAGGSEATDAEAPFSRPARLGSGDAMAILCLFFFWLGRENTFTSFG